MYVISHYLAKDLISTASYLYRSDSVLYTIPVSMNILILICLLCYVLPISVGNTNSTGAYCFKFTWPGPVYTSNGTNYNCTSEKYKGVPCINPIEITPDTTDIWQQWQDDPDKLKNIGLNDNICALQDGYTCIKYTYIYNNAIVNSSHYCGKIIEDKTVAITSGCFYYEVDGHIIEVCACRSRPDSMPCNIAIQNASSVVTLLTSAVILFYNFFNQ